MNYINDFSNFATAESGINRTQVNKNYEIVSVSKSLAELYQTLENFEIDLLLLDISLPDGNSSDHCLPILKKYPKLKILILTNVDDMHTIQSAF